MLPPKRKCSAKFRNLSHVIYFIHCTRLTSVESWESNRRVLVFKIQRCRCLHRASEKSSLPSTLRRRSWSHNIPRRHSPYRGTKRNPNNWRGWLWYRSDCKNNSIYDFRKQLLESEFVDQSSLTGGVGFVCVWATKSICTTTAGCGCCTPASKARFETLYWATDQNQFVYRHIWHAV